MKSAAEMYSPLVSIVIPVYNGSNFLGEAIDSALSQTYANIEVVVVNDGSSDDGETERVALSYGDKIRYFSKENGGSSSALNCGIKNMNGEWFSWLSHDDLYYPTKVEEQVKVLRKLYAAYENEDCLRNNVLFTACEFVNENGTTLRCDSDKFISEMSSALKTMLGNEYLVAEPTRYIFHGCGCLVHKSVFDKVGAFDEKLRLLNDVDLWYRIYTGGYKIQYVPLVLVKGRVHAKQVSRSIGYSYHNPEQDMVWNRSLDWLKDKCPDNFEVFYLYGKNAYSKTRFAEGKLAFEQAKRIDNKKWLKLACTGMLCSCKAKGMALLKKVYMFLSHIR